MLRPTSAGRRLHRSIVWLLGAMLVSAACSPSADDNAASEPSPSTTGAGVTAPEATEVLPGTETSPSTTDGSPPPMAPPYLVYGWEGVTRVHDQGSERLVAEPVRWATEDGAGGIVFESVAEEPGRAWLPAGTDRPAEIPNGFFFLLDGKPTVLVSRTLDDMTQCENEDFVAELSIRDLATGDERFLMCQPFSSDAAEEITSFGGGLLTVVHRWWLIGSGTSVLRFYDLEGHEVSVEHNPFAESCHPCRMHARLSPDGALLAYSLWPTAFSNQPEPADGDYTRAYEEWYAGQQSIPTEVVVMEMTTGVEVFRTSLGADVALTGFDGRIATVTTAPGRELFDIETGATFTAPPAMAEPAPFWTAVLASLDNTIMDYDEAQLVAGDLATQHAVETGVLWSDSFVTLNPGYWAVFTGHFPTQEEALAHCEALDTDCYPRYVATVGVGGPEPVWVATHRRDFPGYAVELVEVHTGDRIVIPANRLDPFPHAVFGDGHGGIVVGSPFAHLPAGSQNPKTIIDTSIDTVSLIDGVPTALYRTWVGESGWDDLIMWDDVVISLIAQPLDGEPTTVLSAHSASRVDYVTGEGAVGEPRPGRSAYGGGVFAVIWTTRLVGCSWLELRDGFSADPAPVVNPWPATECDLGGFGVNDVAVTADGQTLVAWVSTADGGPDLVAWDLRTGREIDRLSGVLHFEHDGDRHLTVVQRAGTDHQTALIEVTTSGFAITPLPSISHPIGVITGELRISPHATLTPAEPWTTCSTADRTIPDAQNGLPARVAVTRDAIASAAIECDLIALADLVFLSSEFRMVDTISYCDEPWPMSLQDDDVVHHWYQGDRNSDELSILLDTLESPYHIADERYVWEGPYDYRIEIDASGTWVRNQRGFPSPACEGMECTC